MAYIRPSMSYEAFKHLFSRLQVADVVVSRVGEEAIVMDRYGRVIARGTDHAEVIQKAIDHVYSLGGGKVYVNFGEYVISQIVVKDNVELVSDGATLKRAGRDYHLVVLGNNTKLRGFRIVGLGPTSYDINKYLNNMVYASGKSNIVIEDNYIEDADDDAIAIESCQNVKIRGNTVINTYKHAIDITGSSKHVVIKGNYVDGVSVYDGITVYVDGGHTITIVGNVVRNVHSTKADAGGIHIEDIGTKDRTNVTVVGNAIEDVDYGIKQYQCRHCVISDNTIKNAKKAGIRLGYPVACSVVGNSINNMEVEQENYGIELHGALATSIVGNSIRGNPSYTIGIYHNEAGNLEETVFANNSIYNCLYGMKGIFKRVSIIGNMFVNINRNAIWVRTSSQKVIIEANFFRDVGIEADNTYDVIYVEAESGVYTFTVLILGNMLRQDNANKPRYFIYLSHSNVNYVRAFRNWVEGIGTGFVNAKYTGCEYRENVGYTTENRGVATVTGDGSTTSFTVDVEHGLVSDKIVARVTLDRDGTVDKVYLVDKDGDGFKETLRIVVTYATAPADGEEVPIYWEAEVVT